MKSAYEVAIHKALGEDITKQLIDFNCCMVIDNETLNFTFQNCPKHLINEIMALKEAQGENSILNEYIPEAILKIDEI